MSTSSSSNSRGRAIGPPVGIPPSLPHDCPHPSESHSSGDPLVVDFRVILRRLAPVEQAVVTDYTHLPQPARSRQSHVDILITLRRHVRQPRQRPLLLRL